MLVTLLVTCTGKGYFRNAWLTFTTQMNGETMLISKATDY